MVRGGRLYSQGYFFAMKLKCCTALAMETWIALTHASIVLWPLCVERLCPSPFCASTNNFWLSLFFFAVWNESSTRFFFSLLPSVLFLIRSAVNLALMAWMRKGCEEWVVTKSPIPLRFILQWEFSSPECNQIMKMCKRSHFTAVPMQEWCWFRGTCDASGKKLWHRSGLLY